MYNYGGPFPAPAPETRRLRSLFLTFLMPMMTLQSRLEGYRFACLLSDYFHNLNARPSRLGCYIRLIKYDMKGEIYSRLSARQPKAIASGHPASPHRDCNVGGSIQTSRSKTGCQTPVIIWRNSRSDRLSKFTERRDQSAEGSVDCTLRFIIS